MEQMHFEQSKSVFFYRSCQVPVVQLEGKTVGLYFSLTSYRSCIDFIPVLVEVYEKLKAKGENFEIVLIPLDEDEESFKQGFRNMPWYSLPLKDKSCIKLARYFDLSDLPTLVIIGPDGKTLHPNAADAVDYHGVEAFPFTPERFEELAQIEKARQDAQTLESLLVSDDRDYLIDESGTNVRVCCNTYFWSIKSFMIPHSSLTGPLCSCYIFSFMVVNIICDI